jgi:Xaa-Pro aminopeptidase
MTQKRRKDLLKLLSTSGADAAILNDRWDIFYLTGALASGYLLLSDGECVLYIPSVEYEQQMLNVDNGVHCESISGSVKWDEMCRIVSGCHVAVDSATVSKRIYDEIAGRVKLSSV